MNMWCCWIKINYFKVTLSSLFICLFFINFLITYISLLLLSWVLRINWLLALILYLHLLSACFSNLLIFLLYFFRKVLLKTSCWILDENVSTSGILHFGATLLWLLIIGGFVSSLVSSVFVLISSKRILHLT